MLVAQPLVELALLRFDQLARGIVGADQQISNDGILRVTQRGDGHHRRQPRAILAHIGQFIDVLDPARGLEHQRLEARRDHRAKLGAERFRACHHLLRVGDIGRRDLVHHLGRGVAKHALGPDVEDLDDAARIRRDA